MKKYVVMAIVAISLGCTPSFAQDRDQNKRENRGQKRDNDHQRGQNNSHYKQSRGHDRRGTNGHNMHKKQRRYSDDHR